MESQNPEIGQIGRSQCSLTLQEGFPNNISSSIVPIIDVTPYKFQKLKTIYINSTGSGGATILTTNATKKTFIVGAVFSFVKNVTCDMATGAMTCSYVQDSVTYNFISLSSLTLTAERDTSSIQFYKPILVDKGSAIRLGTNSFTAGACNRTAVIYYYESETE